MHILKTISMPNGAEAVAHKVMRIEIADTAHAIVNSYRDEEMLQMTWQDNYEVPIAAVAAIDGDTIIGFHDWLVANAGPFHSGTVISGGEGDLELAQLRKWAATKAKREAVIAAGANVPNLGIVQTDPDSMDNIAQAVIGAILATITSQPFTIDFTLADNSVATLDGPSMMGLGKFVGERKSAAHARSRVLRAAIFAAADQAELDAIDTGTGWPA